MKRAILLGLIGCSIITGLTVQTAFAGRNRNGGNVAAVPVLGPDEMDDLTYLREEEKLAHDVYVILYELWGPRVFNNISQSEQRHTDAILGLLNTYGLEDPVLPFGVFADAGLQSLYDSLVETGRSSLLDALYVGALIEEVDLDDIAAAMDRTDQADIRRVYENLLSGSENHLKAFVRTIERMTGESYTAQYLSQDAVNAILGR